jgi:ABC-type antimicrobial peptide transport system permease subunit
MLRNYLTTIIRIITRNKLFSIIHVAGLALGLACAVMIILMLRFEYSFDKFHEKSDQLYVMLLTFSMDQGQYPTERSGDAFGPKIASVFPEVESFCRFRPVPEILLTVKDNGDGQRGFLERSGYATDSSFFEMFTFPVLSGDAPNALREKYSIVLTEEMAIKLFASIDVVGREIRINDDQNFIVTAVISEPPLNTHFNFDFLVPYEYLEDLGMETGEFGGTRTNNVFLLRDGTGPESINSQLTELANQWFDSDVEFTTKLIPLSRVHFEGETRSGQFILIFSLVAVLILVIACINYTNLTTARFTARAREVGIRKAMGASRGNLFLQFLGEAIFNSFIALDLALIMIELMIPFINDQFGIEMHVPYSNPGILLSFLGLILVTGIIAGTYPALALASFNPVKVLKNPWLHGHKGNLMRKILVAFQFTIAVAFIISLVFLLRQFDHLREWDDAIRKDNIIYFETKGKLWDEYTDFKNATQNIPGVGHVASANKIPSRIDIGEFSYGSTDINQTQMAMVCWAGYDYAELFEIDLVAGHFYRENSKMDEEGIIINQKMVDFLQLEEPIGKPFYLYHDRYKIIGVVEDFELFPLSLTNQMLIMPFQEVGPYVFISLDENSGEQTLNQIEGAYAEINPAFPFEYDYIVNHELPLDKSFNDGKPFLFFFTALGIIISLLGLFGLASFTAAQKVKEIGVRKAMGASELQIVKLLSFQFLKPVLISIAIGFTIAYLLLREFLEFFNNPAPLHWYVFVITGIIVLFVSQLTVIGQAMKAARQQPVDCLRYE